MIFFNESKRKIKLGYFTRPYKVIKLLEIFIQYYASQVYLSLFGFSVFAFTLDICFYFESDCKM